MNNGRKRLLKILSEIRQQIAEVRWLADDFLNSRLARNAQVCRGRCRSRRACRSPYSRTP